MNAQVAANPFMNMEEVCAMLFISPETVRLWVRKGKLPKPRRVGRRVLFKRADILKVIENAKV